MSLIARVSNLFPTSVSRTSRRTAQADVLADLPVPQISAEDKERNRWLTLGARLARQKDWQALSAILQKTDRARAMTPSGTFVAGLLSLGARHDGMAGSEAAPLHSAIEKMETALDARPADPHFAAVVAQAHVDAAWICRQGEPEPLDRDRFDAHVERAADILAPYRAGHETSPLMMSARASVPARSEQETVARIADYHVLIDLLPGDPGQLRAFGRRLLPRWYGSYDLLQREAHRAGRRLVDTWGDGGYTWVMMDAIGQDSEAMSGLDADRFVCGLQDILSRRPDQSVVNRLAAFCAVTMAARTGRTAADANRARLRDYAPAIIRTLLTELHPQIWAEAGQATRFRPSAASPDIAFVKGLETARRATADLASADHGPNRT